MSRGAEVLGSGLVGGDFRWGEVTPERQPARAVLATSRIAVNESVRRIGTS